MRKIKLVFLRLLTIGTLIATLLVGSSSLAAPVNYGEELDTSGKTYAQKFSDVNMDHWAFQYIAELVERGAINGYPDGKFRPGSIVTRAEFAKIMVLAAGLTAKQSNYSSYADVSVSDWCSPFIETAKEYLTGYKDASGQIIFKPNTPALREDIAVAVVKLKGYDTRLADVGMLQAMFTDYTGISASAQKYVALAVENGLMSGYPDDTFRAQATITRAEVAAILWRAFQYGNDNKVTDDTPVTSTPGTIPDVTDDEKSETDTDPEQMTKKFSVETLAKVDSPEYLTADQNGNIYFLFNNQVKKLANNQITTLADGDKDFAYEMPVGKIAQEIISNDSSRASELSYMTSSSTTYYFENFNIKGLVYDRQTDKVYAVGYFNSDRSQRIGLRSLCVQQVALFDVNNLSEPIGAYFYGSEDVDDAFYKPDGYLMAIDNGAVLYSGDHRWVIDTSLPTVYRFNVNSGDITKYASVDSFSGCLTSAMLSSGYTIVYDSGAGIYLEQFDLTSGTFSDKKLNTSEITERIDAFTYHDGCFYFSASNDIYVVSATGAVGDFIDSSEVEVKDGLPLGGMTQLIIDYDGNIIFYDAANKVIRRINV